MSPAPGDVGSQGQSRSVLLGLRFSGCDPSVWTGRTLQAESCEWHCLVLLYCIRPICGTERSWPSWISARIRSQSRQGPERPVGSPDLRMRRRDRSPISQNQLANLGKNSLFSSNSVHRSGSRQMMGVMLPQPLRVLRKAARLQAQSTQCGRAYWQVPRPAHCGAIS